MAVEHIGEQERLSLSIRDSAPVLPTHEWMKLCILVNGLVYPQQKSFCFQRSNMVLQIGIAPITTTRARICLRRHYLSPLN